MPKIVNLAGRFKCRCVRRLGQPPPPVPAAALAGTGRKRRALAVAGLPRWRSWPAGPSTLAPLGCRREGTLQRFGPDILDRLAAEKAIPRREAWGDWVMTEEVGGFRQPPHM